MQFTQVYVKKSTSITFPFLLSIVNPSEFIQLVISDNSGEFKRSSPSKSSSKPEQETVKIRFSKKLYSMYFNQLHPY